MIRKFAQSTTVGMPIVKYNKDRMSPGFRIDRDKIGAVIGITKMYNGIPTRMIKECTRSVYKQMKKLA